MIPSAPLLLCAPARTPLAEWASLRNVIVHLYTKLDLQKLHAAYTTKVELLRKFRVLAAALLASAAPPPPKPSSPPSPRRRKKAR